MEKAFSYLFFQLTKNTDNYGKYGEAGRMDSEGRIIEVVSGTEFFDHDRRTVDNKN